MLFIELFNFLLSFYCVCIFFRFYSHPRNTFSVFSRLINNIQTFLLWVFKSGPVRRTAPELASPHTAPDGRLTVMAMAASTTRRRIYSHQIDKSLMQKLFSKIYDHFHGHNSAYVTFKLSNPYALVTSHHLVLSAASPYFKQLFKSEAGTCLEIEITDIDNDTFERLITFCYTGKTLITIDNVDRMLKAAMILQLDDAVTSCVDFLIDHIQDYTLKRVYMLESETQCALLKEKIFQYETEYFMDVSQTDEFLKFDFTKLRRILESDELNVGTVSDAFEAINRWYEHHPFARKQKLPDLISCLGRIEFRKTETIAALSWEYHGESCSILRYYDYNDSWIKWADIELGWHSFQVIFMNDNLIFCGGKKISWETDSSWETESSWEAINKVCSWNFITKAFRPLPSMTQPRFDHCMAVLNDNIYAFGGKGMADNILQSAETYSDSNGWRSITGMTSPRWSAAAVSYNGKIYVTGGIIEENVDEDKVRNPTELRSVECYDPTTDSWTQCADMTEPRYDHRICEISQFGTIGCVSIDGKLWTVGCGEVTCYEEGYYNEMEEKKSAPWIDYYYCFVASKALLPRPPSATKMYTFKPDEELNPTRKLSIL